MKKKRNNMLLLAVIIFFITASINYAAKYLPKVPIKVSGISMNPTISDGDFFYAYKTEDINRLDIIVINRGFIRPNYIKRVVGLPGETIEIKNKLNWHSHYSYCY